jgi:hypothetical protein
MLVSGATALAQNDSGRWRSMADTLTSHLREHYRDPVSHLFYNHSIGYRRHFSSFASQVYSMLIRLTHTPTKYGGRILYENP